MSVIGDLFGPSRYQVPHGFSQCIAGPIAIAVPPLVGMYLDHRQAITGNYPCNHFNLTLREVFSHATLFKSLNRLVRLLVNPPHRYFAP